MLLYRGGLEKKLRMPVQSFWKHWIVHIVGAVEPCGRISHSDGLHHGPSCTGLVRGVVLVTSTAGMDNGQSHKRAEGSLCVDEFSLFMGSSRIIRKLEV